MRRAALTILIMIGVVMLGMILWPNLSLSGPKWATLTSEHMATTIAVTVRDTPRAPEAGRIVSEAFAHVDAMMSEWKDGSPLAAINRNAGIEPVGVPAELLGLIERGIEIGDATDGAFDISWAALWGVWDFKAERPTVPDAQTIASKLPLIDYRTIVVDPAASTVYLPQTGMKIGLGGIAKGYAIEIAIDRLKAAGFEDFLITAGGQVYAAGTKGPRPWQVGIRDPRGSPADLIAVIELTNASASTSGDYERFFEIDGQRYHHILDPRTGRPAISPLSVTVVCDDPTLDDAMSTALMILEPDARRAAIEQTGIGWALIVEQSGQMQELGPRTPKLTIVSDEQGG